MISWITDKPDRFSCSQKIWLKWGPPVCTIRCAICDIFKWEEERRCETHKDFPDNKQAAREIHIKDILTLGVRDYKLREEVKKLMGYDNTEHKYVEAGNTWNLQNGTKEAYMQKTIINKGRPSCNKPSQK